MLDEPFSGLTERGRERSFHISTAISLVILLAVILIPKAFDLGGSDVSRVGLLGPRSAALSFAAINDPDGTLAQVASIVPPISAIVMPPRIVAGDVAAREIGLAAALMIAATCALVPVAARLCSNAVLRAGGRVKLREASRSA